MEDFFLQSRAALLRTTVLLVGAYVGLIVLLRWSGKRTLSKMNAFDLVVTVALGSTLATIGLSKDVALAQGLLALFLLVGLQFVVAWLTVRSPRIEKLVKAEPTLLFHHGRFLETAMRRERVHRDEIIAAIRAAGLVDVKSAAAVVLETDGSFSVMEENSGASESSLQNVQRGGKEAK